ncbi:MAG: hypothetical protein ACK5MK_11610 [Dysgonomonas sp.]
MKKKFIVYVVLISIFLSGCQKNAMDKINDYVEDNCSYLSPGDSCIMNFEEILNFSWDSLYVFGEYTNSRFISKRIRIQYEGSDVPDFSKRMIFVKGNRIVHQETFSFNPSWKNIFVDKEFQPSNPLGFTGGNIYIVKRRDRGDYNDPSYKDSFLFFPYENSKVNSSTTKRIRKRAFKGLK